MSKEKNLNRIREIVKKWEEHYYDETKHAPLTMVEEVELMEFVAAITKDKTRDDLLRLLRDH